MERSTWELLDLYALWKDFGEWPDQPGLSLLDRDAGMLDAFRIFEHEHRAITGGDDPLTAFDLVGILNSAFGGKNGGKK